jgi:site-specific DNA recombinase
VRAVRLRDDAGALGQGGAALPLLHLHRRPEARLGLLPLQVRPRRRGRAPGRRPPPRPGPRPGAAGAAAGPGRQHEEGRGAALEAEQRGLERDLAGWQAEARNLSLRLCPGGDNGAAVARLAELQERIHRVEGRARQVREQLRAARDRLLDEGAATAALALFDPHWESLPPAEQGRVVALLVERVDYDGAQGTLSITFQPNGIQALADELSGHQREERA